MNTFDAETQLTLETFALHIGPLIVDQYAQWQNQSLPNSRRELNALVDQGWLVQLRGRFRKLLPVYEPLVSGEPGGPEIDFGHWAYVARKRFRGRKMCHRNVYIASPRLLGCYGQKRRSAMRSDHLTHDLSLTAIFLHLHRQDEVHAQRWRHEQLFAGASGSGRKIVDALIVDDDDTPIKGIDFLGPCYDRNRLAELAHELLTIRQIRFEFY